MKKNIEVDIICIGDELLIGQTINTNAAWMGAEVNRWGLKVRRAISISDNEHQIKAEFEESMRQVPITLVTGGLGPTKDDITKKTICEFFEDVLIEDAETLARVEEFFIRRNLPMLNVNKMQALVPSKCQVIPNYNGTAPGMWLEKDGHILISMPGVPYEMQGIMIHSLQAKITEHFTLPHIFHSTLMTIGVGESFIAETLSDIEDEIRKAGISLAYLPSPGMVKLRLSSYGHTNENDFQSTLDYYKNAIIAKLGSIVFAETDIPIQQAIHDLMKEKQFTLSVAESCTGGTIQSWLTGLEGASDFFVGGITAYSTNIKKTLLQLPEALFERFPVVSEAVAEAMARSCRQRMQTDYSLATTGYAGPGTENSGIPVGTICISLATPEKVITQTLHLGKNRERNIRMASLHALNLLRINILNK